MELKLVAVTEQNWHDICLLDPGQIANKFVAPNAYSLAEAHFSNQQNWQVKGIMDQQRLIGFTMYGFYATKKNYEIARLMIDQSFQNKGYGRGALQLIIDTMVSDYHCPSIYLSVNLENQHAKHIYHQFGFVPTGELKDHVEEIYCLDLTKSE